MNSTREKIRHISDNIPLPVEKPLSFMEVCGTHTMSIASSGIRALLPEGIRLISGPGCPVCVTSQTDIESALILARQENVLIATFGDMVRVPSDGDRLENYKNVQIVYSPAESLKLAVENPEKEVVFIGVGFETTAPLIAATIIEAEKQKIENFSVLSLHKTVPAALKMILEADDSRIDGLILPGHVSAVTGSSYFDFLRGSGVAGVIAGFKALDIMECIYLLARMNRDDDSAILNNYKSVVTEEGNRNAMSLMEKVFEPCDSHWRGIGPISLSGLKIRQRYCAFDAEKKVPFSRIEKKEPPGCLCGRILLGHSMPSECGHFGRNCTPSDPVGPCMVSSEGTCAAWFKYGTGVENV